MTMWFGKSWGAPICVDAEHVRTPVGEVCEHCHEAIGAHDSGFIVPQINPDGMEMLPYHYECFMRGITGGVAHQLGTCSCFVEGSDETEPPELTKRQAAKLALELWEKKQYGAL